MRQEQYSLLLPVRICFRKSLLIFSERNDILRTRKAPTPKWMPPENWLDVLTDTAYPVGRQDRHFYFGLLFHKPGRLPLRFAPAGAKQTFAGRLTPCHGTFP